MRAPTPPQLRDDAWQTGRAASPRWWQPTVTHTSDKHVRQTTISGRQLRSQQHACVQYRSLFTCLADVSET
jgi:hypothetical protein